MPKIRLENRENPDLLTVFGPTLTVKIGFDLQYRPGRPRGANLPEQDFLALVDTGASESCIDSDLAIALNLPIIDQSEASGVHGRLAVNLHVAQIYIP